jgi:dienelactone hydrolase
MAALAAGAGRTAAGGAPRVELREDGLIGTLFLPPRPADAPAVVCLTGALGGLWEVPAEALAAAGFAALALATHNVPGLPEHLAELPLDNVERAVAWLRKRARPQRDCVMLRGWSRGGKLARLLGSLSPAVNGVLAYASRTYVGLEHGKPNNIIDPTARPAWLWRGAPAQGVALQPAQFSDPVHPSNEDWQDIAVERIRGPIMLVSGAADTGLAGTTATSGCDQAMRRLELFGVKYPHEHLDYPDAGHDIAEPPPYAGTAEGGGTPAGNAAAIADSWPRSLAFLRRAALS